MLQVQQLRQDVLHWALGGRLVPARHLQQVRARKPQESADHDKAADRQAASSGRSQEGQPLGQECECAAVEAAGDGLL